MTKTGQLIVRNSKHLKVTPIILEQYLRDMLSKDRIADTLEGIIKQFWEKMLRPIVSSDDNLTTNHKASMQCDNRAETKSDYTFSPNTTNTENVPQQWPMKEMVK